MQPQVCYTTAATASGLIAKEIQEEISVSPNKSNVVAVNNSNVNIANNVAVNKPKVMNQSNQVDEQQSSVPVPITSPALMPNPITSPPTKPLETLNIQAGESSF